MPLSTEDRVLVLGATGFVGRRLVLELVRKKIRVRVMIRDLADVPVVVPEGGEVEVVRGDALEMVGFERALQGIHTAYYLIHAGHTQGFLRKRVVDERDRQAAANFTHAAEPTGLQRVIYLGATGEDASQLPGQASKGSPVAAILASGRAAATSLSVSMIIGAGATSFDMLRNLAEKFPVMGYPKWIDSSVRPIAVHDLISYLLECLFRPETAGRSFEIGGPELLSYREMLRQYAHVCNIPPRRIVRRPFGTSREGTTAQMPPGVAQPLVHGTMLEANIESDRIEKVIPMELTPFKQAVALALAAE